MPTGSAREDVGRGPQVVRLRVGDEHRVDAPGARRAQAPQDGPVGRPGVDEDGARAVLQERRVALADVEDAHAGAGRRPGRRRLQCDDERRAERGRRRQGRAQAATVQRERGGRARGRHRAGRRVGLGVRDPRCGVREQLERGGRDGGERGHGRPGGGRDLPQRRRDERQPRRRRRRAARRARSRAG